MRTTVALALVALGGYAALARLGELDGHLPAYLGLHALLVGTMLLVVRLGLRHAAVLRIALGAALAFRIVAALGAPALSWDVARYVWDGEVQRAGVHPYRHAPADPALAALRDETWSRINHPDLPTIYPPLAELVFAGLARAGAGLVGFKLALGLTDWLVALALLGLLRQLGWPGARVLLYAWNPLAVVESAGSGHLEPLGVLLAVLAVRATFAGRRAAALGVLGAAVQAKLLPIVLLPRLARGTSAAALALGLATVVLLAMPYAAGPVVPPGLGAFAERWAWNASVYPFVEWSLERAGAERHVERVLAPLGVDRAHVDARRLARAAVAGLMLGWIAWLARRGSRLDLVRATLWTLGGVLLLGPVLHPWYLLWVLPWAAAVGDRGWLALGVLAPLAYTGGADVHPLVRLVEYGIPCAIALHGWRTARAPNRGDVSPRRPLG